MTSVNSFRYWVQNGWEWLQELRANLLLVNVGHE